MLSVKEPKMTMSFKQNKCYGGCANVLNRVWPDSFRPDKVYPADYLIRISCVNRQNIMPDNQILQDKKQKMLAQSCIMFLEHKYPNSLIFDFF